MSDLITALEFVTAAMISIIVISNPISTSAVFLALTESRSVEEKDVIAKRSSYYALFILLFFAITGLLLFELFGFGIGAFRIAGGILLFTTAIGMLNPTSSGQAAKDTSQDIALIPMAIPFISGPGTIVTVVVLMSEAQRILHDGGLGPGVVAMAGVFMGILAVIVISYYMMNHSERIYGVLKEGGRKVITRIMGLLVMAISIQFIINGIKDILPELIDAAMRANAGLI